MARVFLTFVGVAYILLGLWCAIMPEQTSNAVGFSLQSGAGDSEFLTVYGGLEIAIGSIFLWPILARTEISFSLTSCLIIHGFLVLFRTIGFFIFSGIPVGTQYLAATEWLILIGSIACYLSLSRGHAALAASNKS